jgi:hypothetical protein
MLPLTVPPFWVRFAEMSYRCVHDISPSLNWKVKPLPAPAAPVH